MQGDIELRHLLTYVFREDVHVSWPSRGGLGHLISPDLAEKDVMVLLLSAGNVVQSLSFSSVVPLTIWAFTFDWPLLDPAPALGSKFVLGTGRISTCLLRPCTPKSGLHTRAGQSIFSQLMTVLSGYLRLAPSRVYSNKSRVLTTLLQAPHGKHILPLVTGNSLVQACMARAYHMLGGVCGWRC